MNDRILARELEGCSSMAEFAKLGGRYPQPPRTLSFAGAGRSRTVIAVRDFP